MAVQISAIIATRNRASYLRKAIISLVHQTLDPHLYEIVIVDNGSQDDTRQVVEEFASLSNLRYLFEPVTGVSKARNTGWRNAKGEFISFLDDDAIASPEWLARNIQAFEEFGPGVGSIGGKVELIWEAPQPDWLPASMLGVLSVYHYSEKPALLNKGQWLSICNLSYPREVLIATGGLREDLGRKGNKLLAGADQYLRQQIDDLGFRSFYHPEIIVHHHISSYRLTKKWFMNAAYWQGKSRAIMLNPADNPLPIEKKLSHGIGKVFWIAPRFVLMLIATKPAESFRRWCQVIETYGFISGLFSKNE